MVFANVVINRQSSPRAVVKSGELNCFVMQTYDTEMLLPYLTAKRVEGEVVKWFLQRACAHRAYKRNALDVAVLESLSAVKRNGGEAPAEYFELLSEVIPSEAFKSPNFSQLGGLEERVETRDLSLNNNGPQERPALHIAGDDIVRHSEETRRASINN